MAYLFWIHMFQEKVEPLSNDFIPSTENWEDECIDVPIYQPPILNELPVEVTEPPQHLEEFVENVASAPVAKPKRHTEWDYTKVQGNPKKLFIGNVNFKVP